MNQKIILSLLTIISLSGCSLTRNENTSVIPSTRDVSVETSLKTYTDSHGYEVDYPESWSLNTDSLNGIPQVNIKKDSNVQVPDGYSEPCPNNFISVTLSGPSDFSKEYKTFDEFVAARYDEQGSLGSFGGTKEKKAINGLSTYKFGNAGIESVCGGPGYLIQLNDKEYLSAYLGLNANIGENEKVASQIVESIKKTD